MVTRTFLGAASTVAVLFLVVPFGPASAQDWGEHSDWADWKYQEEADRLLAAEDLAGAERLLSEGYVRFGLCAFLDNIGLLQEEQGALAGAVSTYAKMAACSAQRDRAAAHSAAERLCRGDLAHSHGLLRLGPSNNIAEVELSGASLAEPLRYPATPASICLPVGTYTVAATFRGGRFRSDELTLTADGLTHTPIPPDNVPDDSLQTAGWITLTTGLAALGAGVGVVIYGDGELQTANNLARLDGEESDDFLVRRNAAQGDAVAIRTAGWVVAGIGAAAAVTGSVLLIVHAVEEEDQPAVSLYPWTDFSSRGAITGASLLWTF